MADQAPDMSLMGLRVLVVEDRFLVARRIEGMLCGLGCELIGPVASQSQALELIAREGTPRAAVLDIDLAGTPVFALAAALLRRGVAIVFATGFSERALPEAWRGAPRVQKPFDAPALAQALAAALAFPPPMREEAASPPGEKSFLLASAWSALNDSRNLLVEADATIDDEGRGARRDRGEPRRTGSGTS